MLPEDYPLPDSDESYDAFLDVAAERAVGGAFDNGHDQDLEGTDLDTYVAEALPTFIDIQLDEFYPLETPLHANVGADKFALAGRRALFDAIHTRAREKARQEGVPIPQEDI